MGKARHLTSPWEGAVPVRCEGWRSSKNLVKAERRAANQARSRRRSTTIRGGRRSHVGKLNVDKQVGVTARSEHGGQVAWLCAVYGRA
eukprot:6180916-Pleurochrysis_carterae.AAC.1